MDLEFYNWVVGGFFICLTVAFALGIPASSSQTLKSRLIITSIFGLFAVSGFVIPIGWLDGVLTLIGLLILIFALRHVIHEPVP